MRWLILLVVTCLPALSWPLLLAVVSRVTFFKYGVCQCMSLTDSQITYVEVFNGPALVLWFSIFTIVTLGLAFVAAR